MLEKGMSVMVTANKEKRASMILFISCFFVYAVVCMTKSAYASSIASILSEELFDKTKAGLINSGFYLFYGAAQLLFLRVVDRFSPVRLISITLIGTVFSLIFMALSNSFVLMLFFWCFCGLIQFAVWPAVVRLIGEYLHPEHQDKARVYIAFSYCTGMLLSYLFSSVLLRFARWTAIFWSLSLLCLLSLVAWKIVTDKTLPALSSITKAQKVSDTADTNALHPQKNTLKLLTSSGLLLLLVPACLRSSLDLGVKSWVPTMIVENYDVSISFANALTTALIFINLAGVFIAGFMYPKRIKNVTLAFALCFLFSLPFTALLLWVGKVSVLTVVLSLAVITTLMYAGHQLINVIIPSFFIKTGKAGSISAILNAFASFGAVIANFLFGYLAESHGWSVTTASWIVIIVVALLFSLLAVPRFKRLLSAE